MAKLVFDLESDGLLQEATRMWILVTYNLDTQEIKEYLENDLSWKEDFDQAEVVTGHNICGYDLPVLEKLFNYKLPENIKIRDTLVLSRITDYMRFGHAGHSLEEWGKFLGYPKVAHEDWSQYSEEMRIRCITDVEINVKIYNHVMKDLLKIKKRKPEIIHYIKAEQDVATWQAEAELKGWPFDAEGGYELLIKLEEEVRSVKSKLEPRLGIKAIAVDKCKGVVEEKKPRWTKIGFYEARMAKWFDISPVSGMEDRPIDGPYCRVKFEHLKLSSSDDVKLFLKRQGWKPTEYNYRRNAEGKLRRTSPKITEDSLELLGGDGAIYRDYTSADSRYNNLKTWLENIDYEDRLHGDSITIGTPSMRMRHKIIVNVPSVDSPWGKEMRRLFVCPEGWSIIGCDSAGNQARGLAHDLKNPIFTRVILEEDVHLYNAEILINILDGMGISHNFTLETMRPKAKRILYAFLFGCSGKKIWSYLFGNENVDKGNTVKEEFTKAVPGFEDLLEKLEEAYKNTKKKNIGYIPSIAGNRIYVDSKHKCLVYRLQATEKITCSAALSMTKRELEKRKIPYQPLIFYHDEYQFMTPNEYTEEALEIGVNSFKEAPKLFGITIMDGDGKIGKNWCETH